MTHAHTDRLIDAWRLSRGDRRLPPRIEISPAVLGSLLPQVFILGEEADGPEEGEKAQAQGGGWRLRLAGGVVNDLFARDLRGAAFASLWAAADQAEVDAALERARGGAQPVVLKALGVGDGGRVIGLELTLAPATGPTLVADRVVGLVQPTGLVARLQGHGVRELRLAGREAPAASRPRLVVDNTRR